MLHGADRYCIVTQGDTHALFEKNLNATCPPVDVYLRDSHRARDVRDYMRQAHEVEQACFREPSPRFALAHFGLNGPAMVVTAEVGGEVVAVQYVVWDGHAEGRRGLRFWTTVVHPDMRGRHIASTLTAVSTVATQSWASYGSTICDTSSSLMGRNVRLQPVIVTANMFHTEGRRKVQLEWERPTNPFKTLFEQPKPPVHDEMVTMLHTLQAYEPAEPLPGRFYVPADAQVWDDIADEPERFRRRFRLAGWMPDTTGAVLEDTWTHALEVGAEEQPVWQHAAAPVLS
jgi:hypothetical protein